MCKDIAYRKQLLRNRLKHNLHPLHIYCRLCDRYNEGIAKTVCIWYETHIWKWLRKMIELLPEREEAKS